MEQRRCFQGCIRCGPKSPCSAVFVWFLLLISHRPLPSAAVSLSGRGFHPGLLLSTGALSSSLSSSPEESSGKLSPATRGLQLREDEVMFHFYRNGRGGSDYRKPSTSFMVNLFNRLQRGDQLTTGLRHEPVTDTVRCFSGRSKFGRNSGKVSTSFHIPGLPQHERLREAEIRFVNRAKLPLVAGTVVKFRVDVKQNGKVVNKLQIRERATSQLDYHVMDVSQALSPWINDYHGNVSLHVKLSKKLQRQLVLTPSTRSVIVLYLEDREFLKNMLHSYSAFKRDKRASGEEESAAPSHGLAGFPLGRHARRPRRDTRPRKRRHRRNRKWYRQAKKEDCQLYDFDVDFNLIGWGQWIIHPKNFNARFCYGQCPSPVEAKFRPTNHAMLQALMKMKKSNTAPAPCCVPAKLSPVSMLYFEYDEIVVRHHEDMVAEECGCR